MRIVTIAVVLAVLAGIGRADDPAAKQDNPKSVKPGGQADKAIQVQALPADVIAAWGKAGFEVGSMSAGPFGPSFRAAFPSYRAPDPLFPYMLPGGVPAFRFRLSSHSQLLGAKPPPQTAFGLDFSPYFSPYEDAGRHITETEFGMRLRMADMIGSDGHLEALAGLTSLQSLNLNGSKVTDAGLKKLAALKNLQWLGLAGTKVTDAGLKGLVD